ncbi:Nicalin-1, related [Eimeria brunetti]|uniref:BOS complex subunit NCLN n=1 Tax=Eimeria brunetti TaxID=51314 RepID=U6LN42_9EIME|nr:Nicalin-1, related [Eimeria brunetti]
MRAHPTEGLWALVAVICLGALSFFYGAEARSQMALTGYRPLQYRAAANFPLGPWGSVSLQGAPICTCEKLLEGGAAAAASSRVLCVSRATAVTAVQVEKLLETPHFVLLLLPAAGAPLAAAAAEEIKQIEKLLLDRHSIAAVAFARETKDATALLERLAKDEEYENAPARTRMLRPYLTAYSALARELQPIASVKGATLTSWLNGEPGPEGTAPPTIVFVAHHDAFAAVPHFATGISTSASGLITLMWLARELKKIYKQEALKYSVAFVLTDASAMNYEGVAQWIGRTDPRLLNATRYVLCLDNVASASLSLHTPKAYKDPEASRFLQALETALKEEGVELLTRPKKIAGGEKVLSFWPHEHFTRTKLIAGTISAETELKHFWNRSSLTDDSLDTAALVKTVRGLAEGTARFLSNLKSSESSENSKNSKNSKNRLTFKGEGEGEGRALEEFIRSWVQLCNKSPRFFAYRNVAGYMGSSSNRLFLKSLTDEMENAGLSTETHEFDVDLGGFSFSYEPPVPLEIAEARSTFFDWLLLLGAATYSIAIYLAIRGAMSNKLLEGTSSSLYSPSPTSSPTAPSARGGKQKL